MVRKPNTAGLRTSAQLRAQATRQRAEEALSHLLQEQRPVNFKTVAETAHRYAALYRASPNVAVGVASA